MAEVLSHFYWRQLLAQAPQSTSTVRRKRDSVAAMAERVKALRATQTQAQVAAVLGVTRQYVAKLERR